VVWGGRPSLLQAVKGNEGHANRGTPLGADPRSVGEQEKRESGQRRGKESIIWHREHGAITRESLQNETKKRYNRNPYVRSTLGYRSDPQRGNPRATKQNEITEEGDA